MTTKAAAITPGASPCGWPGAAQAAVPSTAKRTSSATTIVKDPIHIRDFQATVLKLLGYDHQRFTDKYQGVDQRLTRVEPARVTDELVA